MGGGRGGNASHMPRSIWTGAISFGLVNVPVKLFTATESKDVRFHQFQRGTGERVRYRRVAEESQEEVAYEDIVKGYEVSKGDYVIVEPEELEAVEPHKSRSIEIEDFIDLEEIDPIYFQKTYFLAPADDSAAKPYQLLRTAMEDAARVGIARFVMRTKEYLAAIRSSDGLLLLETMFFSDEVRDPHDIEEIAVLDGKVDVTDRERRAATQLIDSLSTKWEPDRYRDTYRERVLELIERKAQGEEIVTERPAAPPQVVDLMAALEASVQEARQGRQPSRQRPEPERTDGGRPDGRRPGRYAGMSKEELYEEAQRRDVPGRSKMSKEELVDALQEAS